MTESPASPTRSERAAYYVTSDDALRYAHYFNAVPGGRGWSRVVMEENLPGWTLNEFMALCTRHRLFETHETGGRVWRFPDVVGVLLEGESLVKDRGDLVHPAKAAARRRVEIGHTSPHVRHLRGDDSPIVVHVRMSAATPDEQHLHSVARAAYHASPVRPSLVLNMSRSLIDPFDPPYANVAIAGAPLDEAIGTMVRCYNADVVHMLEHERSRHPVLAVVTLALHEGGEPVELARADATQLPELLRSATSGIVSNVLSIRSDTLHDPHRAGTVADLVGVLGESDSFALLARMQRRPVERIGRAGR